MNIKEISKKFAMGAKSGRAGNVFIDGDAIYSYGYHWPLAVREKRFNGFYINSSKYSVSTSRQAKAVAYAISLECYAVKQLPIEEILKKI